MRWISKLTLPLLLLVTTWCASNINWGSENWKTIIQTDAKGYYAYLPACLIYHDLHFNFYESTEKKYFTTTTVYDYRTSVDGNTIDKYFAGTALAESPFFLIAHVLTKVTGGQADGYSKFYPIFINLGAIFYLLVGLIFIRYLLRSFQVSENAIAFILLLLVFGTNLFYYAVRESGMSHIYSFAFISMFVFYSRKYFLTFHSKNLLHCGIVLGIILLIRPVNVLILFALPFIAGNKIKLKEGMAALLKNKTAGIIAVLFCCLIAGIQPLLYKIQTGHFFVYAYGDEGFNWTSPHLFDFLFSYRKGVFVYAPLLFLSLAGFIYLWKQERFRFWSLLLFLFAVTYVLSCWWNWSYGGSFGSRVMIDYYVFAALLLGLAYKTFEKRSMKIIYTLLLILPTLLCVAQTYQYRYDIIHWDNMDSEKYWNVFLNFDKITE